MRTTVVIVAYNTLEKVKICVESIRMFAEETDIIVIDNASTDGLDEWLSLQEDISYASCEKQETYAEIMNQVMENFVLEENVLLIDSNYALTQGCLKKMQEVLWSSENIALAGAGVYKKKMADFSEYYNACEQAVKSRNLNRHKRVLGCELKTMLIKRTVFDTIGKFDDRLCGVTSAWKDYQQRLLRQQYFIMSCDDAVCCPISIDAKTINDTWKIATERDLEVLEEKYGMHYFNYAGNLWLAGFIEEEQDAEFTVLEIGCDCGATLLEIKERYPNAHICGVELNANAAEIASYFAEKVQCANIEDKNLDFEKESVDYIIFGDVLEHLRNPKETVIYCKTLLKKGGYIIASIPNLMHITVIENLLKGNFTYEETGLLDKTHIHLFTYKEIMRMFEEADFEVNLVSYITGGDIMTERRKEIIRVLKELEPSVESFAYEAFQYLIKAEKRQE